MGCGGGRVDPSSPGAPQRLRLVRGVEEAEKRGPYRERGPWVKGLAGDPCRFLGERLPKAGFVAGQEVRVGFWEEVDAGLGLKDADAGITVAGGRVPRKGS